MHEARPPRTPHDLHGGHVAELACSKKRGGCSYPWSSYCSLVTTQTQTVSMGMPARTGEGTESPWGSGEPPYLPPIPCPQKHVSMSGMRPWRWQESDNLSPFSRF